MWNAISLTPLKYNDLVHIIDDFTCDIYKLTRLQHTGHFPLILANKNELNYDVIVAFNTLEILGKIDQRFLNFKDDAIRATVDLSAIDDHDLLLGHRESFKKEIQKKLLKAAN